MPPAALPPETRHWKELDGVRGLAALLVLYAHLFLMWIPAGPKLVFWARTLSGQAWTGVYLFFLLSGFLIGGILLRNRAAENYYSVFYTRRAFRIFPLYFLLLGSFFAVRAIFGYLHSPEFAAGPVPFWSYFVLVQNFPMAVTGQWGAPPLGVTWSVALEEQFYLFLPLWIRLIPPRWHAASFLFLAALGPIFRAVSSWAHPPFLALGSSEALFLGVFVAWLQINRPALLSSLAWRTVATIVLGMSGAGMLAISARHSLGPLDVTVVTLFWGAFLSLVVGAMGSQGTAWLRNGFLCWLGRISYGVYLFHPLVLTVVFLLATGSAPDHALGLKGFALSALTFGLTLGLASATFYGFERALIARGRKSKYRTDRKMASPSVMEVIGAPANPVSKAEDVPVVSRGSVEGTTSPLESSAHRRSRVD